MLFTFSVNDNRLYPVNPQRYCTTSASENARFIVIVFALASAGLIAAGIILSFIPDAL